MSTTGPIRPDVEVLDLGFTILTILSTTFSIITSMNNTNVFTMLQVPELSFGHNPRLPSASSGIDLQFSPERGRYFIATR